MRMICLVVLWAVAPLALADSQACSEMYPPDAYDPAERAQLIQDCLAAYGDTGSGGDTTYEEESSYSDYDGTVEDYVETLPQPETEESEPVVEY